MSKSQIVLGEADSWQKPMTGYPVKAGDTVNAPCTTGTVSLLRADSRQHVRRILWPEWRRSATMGVLKSVEPTGFLAFAPAFAGTNWADVDRRIIQNCPHGRGRVLSSPPVWFRLCRLRSDQF